MQNSDKNQNRNVKASPNPSKGGEKEGKGRIKS